MNRRDFLASSVASAASLLLPTWAFTRAPKPREIDLRPFCYQNFAYPKFDMAAPFVQENPHGLFRFATDARLCIRVPGQADDRDGEPIKRPPANELPWIDGKDDLLWQSWPAANYQLARANCDECEGNGYALHRHETGGSGRWRETWLRMTCATCKGKGTVWLPQYQRIGGAWIGSDFDAKIRKLLGNAEYNICKIRPLGYGKEMDCIRFRFDGGQGMLAVADAVTVNRLMGK